jgi:hypothetical protein
MFRISDRERPTNEKQGPPRNQPCHKGFCIKLPMQMGMCPIESAVSIDQKDEAQLVAAPLALARQSRASKLGSNVGSVVVLIREVCLPVGIHRPTLRIDARGRERVHARRSVQGAFAGIEHEQVRVRGYLEAVQGERDMFPVIPKFPSGAITRYSISCLRIPYTVFDAAQKLILWAAHFGAEQLFGAGTECS